MGRLLRTRLWDRRWTIQKPQALSSVEEPMLGSTTIRSHEMSSASGGRLHLRALEHPTPTESSQSTRPCSARLPAMAACWTVLTFRSWHTMLRDFTRDLEGRRLLLDAFDYGRACVCLNRPNLDPKVDSRTGSDPHF